MDYKETINKNIAKHEAELDKGNGLRAQLRTQLEAATETCHRLVGAISALKELRPKDTEPGPDSTPPMDN